MIMPTFCSGKGMNAQEDSDHSKSRTHLELHQARSPDGHCYLF